jgi:hypothetical protein
MLREWERVASDSISLNVQRARYPEAPELNFTEVTKYAVEFRGLTPEQNIHAYEV